MRPACYAVAIDRTRLSALAELREVSGIENFRYWV